MGVQGHRADRSGEIEYYARPLSDGGMALVVVNRANAPSTVKIPWSEMRIPVATKVRDLWKHEDFAVGEDQSFTIPAHGSLMFRLNAQMKAPK